MCVDKITSVMFDGKSHTFECVKIAITADFFVYRRVDPIL